MFDDSLSVDDLVALTLEVGKYGVQRMADLDTANKSAYGNLFHAKDFSITNKSSLSKFRREDLLLFLYFSCFESCKVIICLR